jgi:hypothetical protein
VLLDAGQPAAFALALQPDDKSIAGRTIGNENRFAIAMRNAVAAVTECSYLDLDKGRRQWLRRLRLAFNWHILLLSRPSAPLS